MRSGTSEHSLRCVVAAATAAAVTLLTLQARATELEAGGALGLDFNAGADELALLQFSNGSTQQIRGGNGGILSAGVGAIFLGPQPHRLETLLSVGVKYSTMQPTSNADLSFVRVPIELLGFYRNDDWHFRVGGGGALYLVNSLTGSGALSGLDVSFDSTFAGIAQADFLWKELFVGMRYTALSLRTKDVNRNFAANSLGVTLGYYFQLSGQ